MKTPFLRTAVVALSMGQAAPLAGQQQFAELNLCPLENGGTITSCRLGYHTFGRLNADSTNAVVIPAWFTGTSAQLAGATGPGGLVDSTKYFVIAIDPFGNGVSSSPSNSPTQPAEGFPAFTIGDMVSAEHRLVTETLGLRSLAGVVGISLGGMQAFEWAVRYPEMVHVLVPIAATPRPGPFDRVVWEAYMRLVEMAREGDSDRALSVLSLLEYLRARSPAFVTERVQHDSIPGLLHRLVEDRLTPEQLLDQPTQARAIMNFDVSRNYGHSLARAAQRITARTLVISTVSDHTVTPGPSVAFSDLISGAELLLLDNNCGHIGANCEIRRVIAAVEAILEEGVHP